MLFRKEFWMELVFKPYRPASKDLTVWAILKLSPAACSPSTVSVTITSDKAPRSALRVIDLGYPQKFKLHRDDNSEATPVAFRWTVLLY